jgi:hypothetical protein
MSFWTTLPLFRQFICLGLNQAWSFHIPAGRHYCLQVQLIHRPATLHVFSAEKIVRPIGQKDERMWMTEGSTEKRQTKWNF